VVVGESVGDVASRLGLSGPETERLGDDAELEGLVTVTRRSGFEPTYATT
jgi:hypothetical protein